MRSVLAGNWKMNKVANEVVGLISDIDNGLGELPEELEVIVAPAYPFLGTAVDLIGSGRISIAAQNCHFEESGAFTGEVSVQMLRSIGVTHCIVGHSERRQFYNESDKEVGKKMKALLDSGLTPIYCCGEKEEDRRSDQQFNVVEQQLNDSLAYLDSTELEKIIVAYEPVWAIGTGLTASAEQAQEMHAFIRGLLSGAGGSIPILYGGSCKPSNADELFACPDVNGGLIGGASLNAQDFLALIDSLYQQKQRK